jgi:hypothetical protein
VVAPVSARFNVGEYAMISKAQCMDLIASSVPEFGQDWEDHRNYWKGEEAGLCNDISAFSSYVGDQCKDSFLTLSSGAMIN